MAEPKPVRSAEGTVPRHSPRTEEGPERISLRVAWRVWWWDCWTRVLRRSAGWRRTAERRPEVSPAVKWKAAEGVSQWLFLV